MGEIGRQIAGHNSSEIHPRRRSPPVVGLPVDGPCRLWNRWRMPRYRTPADLARSVAQIHKKPPALSLRTRTVAHRRPARFCRDRNGPGLSLSSTACRLFVSSRFAVDAGAGQIDSAPIPSQDWQVDRGDNCRLWGCSASPLSYENQSARRRHAATHLRTDQSRRSGGRRGLVTPKLPTQLLFRPHQRFASSGWQVLPRAVDVKGQHRKSRAERVGFPPGARFRGTLQ